jgi:hypothetical protein
MSEIKHTFQAGKMNKDLDERLVPRGEYRDALNIEVRTSDGGDAGTVQTLYGNKERVNDTDFSEVNPTVNWYGKPSKFVGSVTDGKTDRAYFFIASPEPGIFDSTKVTETKLYKDMVIMYDSIAKTLKPVVTDIFRVEFTNITSSVNNDHIIDASTVYDYIDVPTTSGNDNIRPGMQGRVYDNSGNPLPGFSVADSDNSKVFTVREVKYTAILNSASVWRVYFTTTATGVLTNASVWTFEADKVLNFTSTNSLNALITSVNVIDNLLLWTDNKSEPKKVNIDRCIGEVNGNSESFDSHSRLKITKPGTNTLEYAITDSLDPGLKEEHITVIRRAPRTSLRLEMSSFEDGIELDVDGSVDRSFVDNNGIPLNVGSEVDVEISGIENTSPMEEDGTYSIGFQYTAGQVVVLENDSNPGDILTIRALVVSAQWGVDPTLFISFPHFYHTLRIISIDPGITLGDTDWVAFIEQAKPLFELNLGRFSYRYKYQDGEYSSFAPWSELAFLPGNLDYIPKKGYNLGMVNTLRYLRVTDFIVDDSQRPDDIIEVDILYKDTVSPNVRVVKSIKKGVDPEWDDNSDIGGNVGVVNISSEMMHRSLPSSQILRAWDNVPREAKAQEVVGNRVVYGNYLQNFDITSPPVVNPSVLNTEHQGDLTPAKSLKSIRKYKVGVVFGDKYGRETAIMGIGGRTEGDVTVPSSVSVEKVNSSSVNQLQAKLSWSSPPEPWMEYYKYYVKETTNEYYNLVLHRWYNAEDGNVWLAFASADRNKLDEETYLTLKNRHGSEAPITEEARYKVLAIENEAPDYVKITEKVIGEALVDNELFAASDIHDAMIINLKSDDYTSQLADTNFEGTGYIRIKVISFAGVIATSKWIQIAQMKDSDKSIVTTEPFGESAKLYDNFGLEYDDNSITWSIEVKDNVVENRPEFDGRFFVKVVRDGVLSANILQTVNSTTSYNILDTLNFSSISTTSLINPANSSAAYQGNYAGEALPVEGTLSNNKTNYSWNDSGTVSGISNNNEFNNFANGCEYEDETRGFWESNQYNPNSSHNGWFIDEARQAKSFVGGDDPSLADLDYSAMNGLRNSNGRTHIDFSVVGVLDEDQKPMVPSGALPFKEHMQTNGTLFKFLADPLDEIYRVVSSTSISWKDNFNQYAGIWNGCLKCSSTNVGQGDGCHRGKFTVSFEKGNGGGPLDTNVWDPRSVLSHDGTESSKIIIVEAAFSEGSTLDFKTGNAIWETEPKEDVGLDLYYEATNALPIELSQENIESFCPTESPITVYRPGATYNPTTVANTPVVNTAVRDVISVRDYTSEGVYPFKIAKNDNLKFIHENGAATEAKVIDHMYPIPLYSNTYSPNGDGSGESVDRSLGDNVATYKSSYSITIPCTVAEIVTVEIPDEGVIVVGCMDALYLEYDPLANEDNGSCITLIVEGCTDINATNYNPDANLDDSTCYYPAGCSDPNGTTPPAVGCLWNSAGNGTIYDGIVVKRTTGATGTVTGYMVMMADMLGGGKHDWYSWSNTFDDLDQDNSPITWPTLDELELIRGMRPELEIMPGFTTLNPGGEEYSDWRWSSTPYLNYAYFVRMSDSSVDAFTYRTNAMRVRGIIPFTYTPEDNGNPVRGLNTRISTSELAVVGSLPSTFFTGANGELWEAVSATDTSSGFNVTLPVGTFITSVTDDALTYSTTNDDLINLGAYDITFQKVTGYYKLDSNVHASKTTLPWFNCYSFGNGLESDRIRDDYNAPQIDNGVKVSTLLDSYGEERRSSGMIYSGIYNSTSGVNNLNEFNMAEKITKDLNPSYGSIQALKTRDTNVVAFCEDKVFKILANKNALYNADGSVNLVASDRVLGNATAFSGEYGISSNPESLAFDGYRMYFTDKQRSKVLRLSQDGLTPISDIGMTSWFRDSLNNLEDVKKQELIGTFDNVKGEYNLSLRHLDNDGVTGEVKPDITVSFNEKSKGWSSFKSFVPEIGLSINDEYLTGKNAKLWSHHDSSVDANTFYGESLAPSTIDVVFNENPGSVKSFLAMNYEGSQARINKFVTETVDGEVYSDGEYYNLTAKKGWYVDSFNTDLQEARIPGFKQKEGKWFNHISGVRTSKSNIDTSEFSVQGIGMLASTTTPVVDKVSLTIRENND